MIGSSLLRNDESVLRASPIDDAAPVLPCAAATSPCAVAWLGLLGSAAAAATACWNSGVTPADCSALWILSGSELNSSDRNTATPRVPPSCRKHVADEVATPMSLAGTMFCTAINMVCIHRPS